MVGLYRVPVWHGAFFFGGGLLHAVPRHAYHTKNLFSLMAILKFALLPVMSPVNFNN